MKYIGYMLALLALVVTVACAAPAAPPPTAVPAATTEHAPPANTVNIDIKLFTYKPDTTQVPVGTTIVWTNQDAIEHSVTNGVPPNPAGAFDSGFFTQGKTFSFTFDKPGEYPYFCMRHNSIQGTIKVVAQ